MSPTQLALRVLRKMGLEAGVVEKHLPHPKPFGKKHDFFGIIDIIACAPDYTLGIQVTSKANGSDRVKKALAEPRLQTWLGINSRRHFEVWVVSKRGSRWHYQTKRILWRLIDGTWSIQEMEWSEPKPC